MLAKIELEILEIVEAKKISYDAALDFYYRKQRQIELAKDRQSAHKVKESLHKNKQARYIQAAKKINNTIQSKER